MIITIDGPTASGKTTLGKKLAQKLGMFYLYSGSLFRVLAYLFSTRYNYTAQTIAQITKEALADILTSVTIEYQFKDGEYYLYLDGVNVTNETTNDHMGLLASIVGANAHVREYIAEWQKEIVKLHKNSIVDGRDSGTYVFPYANKKLFITASQEVRAKRLQQKQDDMGQPIAFETALTRIKERDDRDSSRAIAPLKVADDAIVIDNSDLNAQETLKKVIEVVQ